MSAIASFMADAVRTGVDIERERCAAALAELQTAALKVVEETDRIHDNEPWPTKYRAPYGAIVELRALLTKQLGAR